MLHDCSKFVVIVAKYRDGVVDYTTTAACSPQSWLTIVFVYVTIAVVAVFSAVPHLLV